jgi:hypothetical protein
LPAYDDCGGYGVVTVIEIRIEHAADSDAEELSRVTHGFARQALDDLDVHSVDFARDHEAPVGTKAGDASTLGHLAIVAVPSTAVLRGLISLARAKVQADATRSVKLTIDDQTLEVTNVSKAAQEDAIRDWIEKVTDTRDDG